MKLIEPITRFSGEYRFLSNFWIAPVMLDGEVYVSVEHAYQAAKTIEPEAKTKIRNALTPNDAKRLGNLVALRPDWEQVKLQYMKHLVWEKFSRNQDLGQKLLATEDAELIEGNTWGDRFWGVCKGIGENNLGKILMQVRTDLRGVYGKQS